MKKKILLVILILVLVGAVLAAMGAIKTVKNAMIVKGLLVKVSAGQNGIQSYPPLPATLEITDEEVNAGLDLLCNANQLVSIGQKLGLSIAKNLPINLASAALPCQFFNNFKIEFGTAEYSATARLLEPAKGDVGIKGEISAAGQRNVQIIFKEANLNGQKVSSETMTLLENTANQEMNKILDQMRFVVIESIDVSPGKITIKGIFSLDELLCNFGVSSYCLPTMAF